MQLQTKTAVSKRNVVKNSSGRNREMWKKSRKSNWNTVRINMCCIHCSVVQCTIHIITFSAARLQIPIPHKLCSCLKINYCFCIAYLFSSTAACSLG
jgi:hypothetical protein